ARGTVVDTDNHGKPLRMAGTVLDITDRKEAEEAVARSEATLKTLLQAAPIGIGQVNKGLTLGWTNQLLCRMMGYSQNELEGASAAILYENEKEFLRVENVKHPEIRARGTATLETRFRRKDGSSFDVLLGSSAIVQEDLSQGMVFTAMDITARKRLEKQLLESQKMEAVGTLAGGIAHDFNNLLQVIQGYADMALMDLKTDQTGHTELYEIKLAAKRAAELTQGLLTFSRRVESQLRPVDLNFELAQVSRMLERTIPKMIEIELDLAKNLSYIDADPSQLHQLVMNLAVNARDAMPDGGTLRIGTRESAPDNEFRQAHPGVTPGTQVVLEVSDSGSGMDDETVEHIFDPFFTTKEPGKGTGLGLSIVFGIVKGHGGTITCSSEPGAGTAFKIYFPAMETPEDVDTTGRVLPIVGGSETILVIDDEASVRSLGERIFRRFGYSVISAVNGLEGLEVIRREGNAISLVILDLIMPEMGGIECLREIQRIVPSLPVIVASGYASDGRIDEAERMGAVATIRKPYEAAQLLGIVRDVLDG
ncbi:ATP-binding protein, partial [Thermodesulfobacteriota bacterium]